MIETLGQDLVEVVSHLQGENERYHEALEEMKRILDNVPYREYTTNKIRYRLFNIVNNALEVERNEYANEDLPNK